MNSIKKASLTLTVAVLAMVLCFTAVPIDESDAASVGDITYNSETGMTVEVSGYGEGTNVIIEYQSGDQVVLRGTVGSDGIAICTDSEGRILPTGTIRVDVTLFESMENYETVTTSLTIYQIEFDMNGGSGTEIAPVNVSSGGEHILPDANWTKDGQDFVGWATSADASVPEYSAGDSLTVTGDTVLYAVYGESQVVSVTGVSLDRNTANLGVGDRITLVANVMPESATDRSVTWSTSDNSVVTVDQDGNVVAVGIGDAIITVTTTDGGHTATCAVEVTEDQPVQPTLESIEVTSMPTETMYFVGERLDLSGLRITANYSDGSREVTGYVTNPADGSVITADMVGNDDVLTVTVSFTDGGVTRTVTFDVDAYTDFELRLDYSGMNLDYDVGDSLDTTGLKITAVYSDEYSVDVQPKDCIISPVSLDQPGVVTVSVTYSVQHEASMMQATVSFAVYVTGLEAIPDKTVYTVGEEFDPSMTVSVFQDRAWTALGADDYTVDSSAVDMSAPGTYTVTVTYQTFTATFDVTVRAPGDVMISVNVIGGGPTNKVVLTVDGVETEFTRNGTLLVEEGSVVTVAYSTSGLLDPTITVGGEPISNGGTFVAGSDTTLRVVFFVDDDDDNPINPPVVATGDDDDIVYAVAIAAGVIVAVFVAVYVIYGRKD